MAIKLQNKRSAEFSTASMSDLVFLLLIFFMITSTLVAPNVINLILPKSDSGKQLAARNIEVYIDEEKNYYVNPKGQNSEPTPYEELLFVLQGIVETDNSEQRTIILRADKSVPIECVVAFYDVLNALNAGFEESQRYRLLLATEAKS
ncbi:MAG: biopolymer transporter ExbD [Bacteroidetes bacterium]|nr:biopolymer transporter ExbD [Bacteroidota bacterium]MCL1969405.1 biopolymer transporter ExbD [Bacteroidota bacterium]